MSQSLEEQAVRQTYRVVCDPSWRVEKRYGAEWKVVAFCGTEDAAYRSLERHVTKAIRFSQLTDDERIRDILRCGRK